MTRGELASILGVSVRTIASLMSEMRSAGILERRGSKKTGEWVINRLF